MYDDEYNRKIAGRALSLSKRAALNRDRLNGAGARGYDESDSRELHPAQDYFEQQNRVFEDDITRPNVQPRSVVRARAARDLGAGRGAKGGGFKDTALKVWKTAVDIPRALKEGRDLKNFWTQGGRARGGMVGFPDRGPISNVEPASVVRGRAHLDLGAGRTGAGMTGGILPLLALPFVAKLFGSGRHHPTGGIGPLALMAAPIGLNLLSKLFGSGLSGSGHSADRMVGGIVGQYMRGQITKGGMTKMIKDALPHGKKKLAGGISKDICGMKRGRGFMDFLKSAGSSIVSLPGKVLGTAQKFAPAIGAVASLVPKTGKYGKYAQAAQTGANILGQLPSMSGEGMYGGAYDFDEDEYEYEYDDEEEMEGGALPLHMTGSGQGRMCGGYGPVAPTMESLYGYDNRNQPRGLMPPDSVNQQAGMGDEQFVSGSRGGRRSRIQQPVSMNTLGHDLTPQDNMQSGIGGNRMCPRNYSPVTSQKTGRTYNNKCEMSVSEGGRRLDQTADRVSGSIIPELQGRKSNIGSGARSARGAMISQLMREKGMSLGEASRYIKEHKMK